MKCLDVAVWAAIAALCLQVSANDAPVFGLDFDELESRHDKSLELRAGQGADGGTGCWVGLEKYYQKNRLQLNLDTFTVDLKFRLDDGADGQDARTLLCYVTKQWNQGFFLVRLTRDMRLEVVFKHGKSSFSASSDPLSVDSGRFHTARLTRAVDGELSGYLDGVLVLSKKDAPSLASLQEVAPDPSYPVLRLGHNFCMVNHLTAPFNGIVDGLAIYDHVLGAPGIAPLEEAPAKAGVAALPTDVLVLDAVGRAKTPRFSVLEQEGALLGTLVQADGKFIANAATAGIAVGDRTLEVEFDCPVPKDVPIRRTTSVWVGDGVEFFVRPDPASDVYFQYAVSVTGAKTALKYGKGAGEFGSAFTAAVSESVKGYRVKMSIPLLEVFAKAPESGSFFTANFVRRGPTAGGVSTWAPVGRNLQNVARFGKVVCGGSNAYFGRRLEAVRREIAGLPSDKARSAAMEALTPLAKAVSEDADKPAAFSRLEALFGNFDLTLTSLRLQGEPLVVFAPRNPWQNEIEPNRLTRPLEKIILRVARNSKTWYGFSVGNLSGDDFWGQVKVFDTDPDCRFSKECTSGVARHFRVYEALPVDMGAKSLVYDPLAPLPMNSVLRVPAHHTALVWLEFDSSGLEAGRHRLTLCVKRAREMFRTLKVPIEVEVVDADLSQIDIARAGYDWIPSEAAGRDQLMPLLGKLEKETVYTSSAGLWPTLQKDGSLSPCDFTRLDGLIDARLKAGMNRERFRLWLFLSLESRAPMAANGKALRLGERDYEAALREVLERLSRHMKERYGVDKRRIILYTVDEPEANDPIDVPDLKTKMAQTYYLGKLIKSFDAEYVTFVNPHATGKYADAVFCRTLERLSECYDIIEFYRPNLTPSIVAKAKALPFKEFWTYSILHKATDPAVYARDVWANMRDGFDVSTYWHIEDMAGGDGFDSTDVWRKDSKSTVDYGSVYVDHDNGYWLESRRSVAHDLAHEDLKLVKLLQKRFANDPQRLSRVSEIVRKAADAGMMADMEKGRMALLDLVAETAGADRRADKRNRRGQNRQDPGTGKGTHP